MLKNTSGNDEIMKYTLQSSLSNRSISLMAHHTAVYVMGSYYGK